MMFQENGKQVGMLLWICPPSRAMYKSNNDAINDKHYLADLADTT